MILSVCFVFVCVSQSMTKKGLLGSRILQWGNAGGTWTLRRFHLHKVLVICFTRDFKISQWNEFIFFLSAVMIHKGIQWIHLLFSPAMNHNNILCKILVNCYWLDNFWFLIHIHLLLVTMKIRVFLKVANNFKIYL